MAIVGFSFNKMMVERKGAVKGKVNIKNDVTIKSVEKADLSLGSAKQDGLRFNFEFVASYEPKIGEILLAGEVLDIQPEKKADEIAKSWKKDKKVDGAVMTQILNTILARCNVQALILGKDINLPAHIPLPKVTQHQAATEQ